MKLIDLSRRAFIGGTAAMSVVGIANANDEAVSSLNIGIDDPEDDYDDLFWENAEPVSGDFARTRALRDWPLWRDQAPRPQAVWAPEGGTIDTAHIPLDFSDQNFEVTGAVFRRALRLSGIPDTGYGHKVLFGFRAAKLLNADAFVNGAAFQPSLQIAEDDPNHFNVRCVIGVWDAATDTFWASQGSTVPNVEYMFGQAQAGERDRLCNKLSTGVYRYVVGTHRNGSRTRQPGAFRLASNVAVVRNMRTDVIGYHLNERWEYRGPDIADNIHAAYIMREGLPRYSSAGCQVLPGTVASNRTRPTGAWREFRIAAGLKPDPVITASDDNAMVVSTDEDGVRFAYILLAARELRVAAEENEDTALLKLRRGSKGPAVEKLQRAMNMTLVDGDFGVGTQRAFIVRQSVYTGNADGVLTPARLAALNLPETIFAS